MAQFSKIQLTRLGKNIIIAGQNKQQVVFTKVELGDGLLPPRQSIDDLTELVHSVTSMPLQNFVDNGDGTARLRFVVDNNNLVKGFFNREIGVFAKVGEGEEQLYAYANAGNLADYIPGKESPISSKIINLHIIVGNAANLTIIAENSAYVTKLDMSDHRDAGELDHPDGSVTTPKIKDEAVTGDKIAQGAIEKKHLKRGTLAPSDVGAYSKKETDELIKDHRTATELDHPEKSVHKKHLHADAYDSPALTGMPTAPTAANGTNTTQIASTAFVAQAIAALVSSAPGTLDTLQELARALGDDANFATTVTDALAGKLGKNETAVRAAMLEGWSLERSCAYQVGDIAYSKNLPSWARLECVRAGTTAEREPGGLAAVAAGTLVTDGGVLWVVDDVRDGTPVGSVRGSLYLPPGYVKANGATVQRADYPRLVAFVDRYNLWKAGSWGSPGGLFGRGNGSSTFVLPNWVDRMAQFSADGIGASVAAGLPNITGRTFNNRLMTELNPKKAESKSEGAILRHDLRDVSVIDIGGAGNSIEIGFDASKSNPIYGASATVQPPAIKLIPIIRY